METKVGLCIERRELLQKEINFGILRLDSDEVNTFEEINHNTTTEKIQLVMKKVKTSYLILLYFFN